IIVEIPAERYGAIYRGARAALASLVDTTRLGPRGDLRPPVRVRFTGAAFFDGFHQRAAPAELCTPTSTAVATPRCARCGNCTRSTGSPRRASRFFRRWLLSRRPDVTRHALHHPGGPTGRAGRHGGDPHAARRGRGRGGPGLRPGPDQSQARSLRGARRSVARRARAGRADSRRPFLRRRYAGARFLSGLTPSACSAAAASITP